MTEPFDLIVGSVLIDRISRGGTVTGEILGGAGLYALSGAALWSRSALLVTGIGEDLDAHVGRWLDENGLSRAGLRIVAEPTARNIIEYESETRRTERPLYGPEHFDRLKPRFLDLAPWLGRARSAYVFGSSAESFWDELPAARARHGFRVLWEISTDACFPANRPEVTARLSAIDAFSLNEPEAAALFGVEGTDQLIAAVGLLPVPTYLRAGRRGSYLAARGRVFFIPGHPVASVDVTGAGNAYSGGVLAGLALGYDPLTAGQMGTIAAAFAVMQHGPPASGHEQTRKQAQAALRELDAGAGGATA
jgi:sugar/nucleoside kinase (ribokinase family)